MIRYDREQVHYAAILVSAVQPTDLAALAASTRYVLLDFDGPVCDLFEALPPDIIAATLLDELRELDPGLAGDLHEVDDPLDLLDEVNELRPELTARLDGSLREAEADAAAMAPLTAGVQDFLEVCARTGRPVAIVSNNAAQAVRVLLDLHDLTPLVRHVQGRDRDPRLMKPDPTPLLHGIEALSADPSSTTMIGDSSSDMIAAQAAGVRGVAVLTSRPEPGSTSSPAWAEDMSTLAEVFDDHRAAGGLQP